MGDLGLRVVSGDIFQEASLTGPTYSDLLSERRNPCGGWLSHLALLCLAESGGWSHAIFLFRLWGSLFWCSLGLGFVGKGYHFKSRGFSPVLCRLPLSSFCHGSIFSAPICLCYKPLCPCARGHLTSLPPDFFHAVWPPSYLPIQIYSLSSNEQSFWNR